MAFIDDFKTRFPEFAVAEVDNRLPRIEPTLSCYYGGVYGSDDCEDEIILLLAAHLFVFETEANAGKTGTVRSPASKSVGNVSISYTDIANPSANRKFFHTTTYGQRYLQATARNAPAGLFV